jgi:sulfur-carrier protein
MPTVAVTSHLARFMPSGARSVAGATAAQALDAVFKQCPGLRSYVLDEHGRLRQHMNVFIDGRAVRDRVSLADAVQEKSEIYIFQALSGGL